MSAVLARHEEIFRILQDAPFFDDLSWGQRKAVFDLSTIQERKAGEPVYRIGEPAEHFYVLMRGIVRLTSGIDTDAPSAGDILQRGHVFGWASLVASANRRIATAMCMTPASTLAIDGAGLVGLMERNHTLGYALLQRLVPLITGTAMGSAAG